MNIREDNFKHFWLQAICFATLTSLILAVTGVDNYVKEMRTLNWPEVLGLTYYLFILPWYLSVAGAIGWKFWPRHGGKVVLPAQARLMHLCNVLFLLPGLIAPVLFLPAILRWAFGPRPSVRDWMVMIAFYFLFQSYLAKKCLGFLKWTLAGLFGKFSNSRMDVRDLSEQG